MGDELALFGSTTPPASMSKGTGSYSTGSSSAPDLGFHSVMNRQQMSGAHLRTLQAPAEPMPSRPIAQAPSQRVRQSAPSFDNPLSPQMQDQVRALLEKAPAMPNNVANVEDLIRSHYKSVDMTEGQAQATVPAEATPAVLQQQSAQQPRMTNRLADPTVRAQAMNEYPVAMQWNLDNATPPTFAPVQGKAVIASNDPRMMPAEPVAATTPQQAQPAAQSTQSEYLPDTEGVTDSVGDFFQSLMSGLSLGFYRPKGDPAPTGMARVIDPFKSLLYDAPIRDLAMGVPLGAYKSANNAFDGKEGSATPTQVASAEPEPSRRRGGGSKPWLSHTRT